MTRFVLHVDLDEFVVGVELLRHPELRGLPVVVADEGDLTRRGVVAGASYEARKYGVHSAMPLRRAASRCPTLVCLPLDIPAYYMASEAVMATLRSFPGVVVEVAGWDEAFVEAETSDPQALANDLREAIRVNTGLSCAVGIGDNKLQAKTATGLGKPGGIARLCFDTWKDVVGRSRPDRLPGIGPKTARRLGRLAINSISELAGADPEVLVAHFGPVAGPRLIAIARGEDASPVVAERPPARSHGHEVTFQRDLDDPVMVLMEVQRLAETVAREVAEKGRAVTHVTVTIRFAPFDTHTRSVRIHPHQVQPQAVVEAAVTALAGFALDRPVRLVGVRTALAPREAHVGERQTRSRMPATPADSAQLAQQ